MTQISLNGGALTKHQVGLFSIFEYINPNNVSLIFITVKDKQTIKKYSHLNEVFLGSNTDYVSYKGEVYHYVGVPNSFAEFIGDKNSIEAWNSCHHDVKAAIRFCSFLSLHDI